MYDHGICKGLKPLALLIALAATVAGPAAWSQDWIRDEADVPEYTLPDPLTFLDGTEVTTVEQWQGLRRAEILRLFETQMFGRAPERPRNPSFQVVSENTEALGGAATGREILVPLTDQADGPHLRLLLFIPNGVDGPAPAFLGVNFYGNYTITDDPDVPVTDQWTSSRFAADEENRGAAARRWPVALALDRGYAVATFHASDVDPDFDDGFQNGIHPYYYREGQERPAADEWATIAAWAFGLSCALDYLETDGDIDHERVAVMGHSRMGKTSLWAGATDPRFALVISNQSGCGGAALSRREFGETVRRINTTFPHWFCDNFKQYNDRVHDLPIDQHMLIALMAPRPTLICSATEDLWADPRGEFLSGRHADPVYALFGKEGLGTDEMPGENQLVGDAIGYHISPGPHNIGAVEWTVFCDFADRWLRAND